MPSHRPSPKASDPVEHLLPRAYLVGEDGKPVPARPQPPQAPGPGPGRVEAGEEYPDA